MQQDLLRVFAELCIYTASPDWIERSVCLWHSLCIEIQSLIVPSPYPSGYVAVFLLVPTFSILPTWWLEKAKRTEAQDAQAEINIYTLYVYINSDFRYRWHIIMCQWPEQQTHEYFCAALFNHNFFLKIFFCRVLSHNITMKQIMIDHLLLFNL